MSRIVIVECARVSVDCLSVMLAPLREDTSQWDAKNVTVEQVDYIQRLTGGPEETQGRGESECRLIATRQVRKADVGLSCPAGRADAERRLM
jgi:hypothetical protein